MVSDEKLTENLIYILTDMLPACVYRTCSVVHSRDKLRKVIISITTTSETDLKEIEKQLTGTVAIKSRIPLLKPKWEINNQSRTNGPINAHLTIAQVMPRYNHNNEKQEALL